MQEEKFNKQDGNLDQPIVNESLALAGLFRKVFVSERLPKEFSNWFTDKGELSYTTNNEIGNCWADSTGWTYDIEWWLEEIELPTDEELKIFSKEWANVFEGKEKLGMESANYSGQKRIMDFVLAGKAVTAKDNVR